MMEVDTRNARTRRSLGVVGGLIGVAHFLVPQVFDPFNRLGFPNHARTFTYLNGAIETALGFVLLRAHRHRPSTVLSACYVTYLTVSILRTQLRTRRGVGHRIQRSG